ncbi:NTP transferase domain-containing protein [Erythrobacter arachoides]|uniref:NTP transferase domain-containing protein n=1 Tax=Aurantiacibacter arachoides TaxID=1850444 RepID=A0A844ZZW7_9SPHN|nr:NTP transferase domain-containing protein [Aurantiacibacter arachoides]MXO93821.1 NTP transferase domain-containing protein [Aurantiacibacter arachoides]GGD46421.1 molybdopterin-guanine dinucleotide biosynthesis protein A [Aurantiacibacter arachoides]
MAADAAREAPLVAVLAAGSATRFGGGKLDAECAGKRVGAWAISAVARAGLEAGVIVVPPDPPAFATEAGGWKVIINPDAAEGLGTSVALAARRALAEGADLLILLADMPLIEPAHLRDLLSGGAAAATAHGLRAGVPAFVPRALLGPLTELAGEGGAGPVLARLDDLRLVTASQGTLLDVDRPQDLQIAAKVLARREA